MTRILVVEDEPGLRADLVDYLNLRGFTAAGAGALGDAQDALARFGAPDVAILDIGLPDGNGLDLARTLRDSTRCGVIILTAHDGREDRIKGFESGADIYLVKHSTLREIEAAVQSLVRRISDLGPAGSVRPADGWTIDPAGWVLRSPGGHSVKLTATELNFLKTIMTSDTGSASRTALVETLARPRTQFEDRHLDAVVSRLRRKIEKATGAEAPIRVIYGYGYAFVASGSADDPD